MKILLLIACSLGLIDKIYAHGRSEEMLKELNAPVPEWIFLAKPVKVEPIANEFVPATTLFRPRSGGATNSRNMIQLPEHGIEFKVDFSIDWSGNNAEGLGVSLSPDRTKLIVNSGLDPHLYEITSSGEHRELPIRLPNVTYDEGPKGYITKWSWVSDEILIGRSGITDDKGHELLEVRFYLFYLKEKILARLDFGELKLVENTAGMEIVDVGNDLEHLRFRLGESVFPVKADLKSIPTLISKNDILKTDLETKTPTPTTTNSSEPQKTTGPNSSSTEIKSVPPSHVVTKTQNWSIISIIIIVVLGSLWFLIKKRF